MALHWRAMRWPEALLPEAGVEAGERLQLRLPRHLQDTWLQEAFGKGDALWLETGRARLAAGTPFFCRHVACLLRDCGLIANLSLRENLLLPFLYHGDVQALTAAAGRLQHVAAMLQLTPLLGAKAEEHCSLVHALAGLGRCLLLKPHIIIAQEIHDCVPVDRMPWFQAIWDAVLARLDAGLVYLCSGDRPDWGLRFDRILTLQGAGA